MESDQRANGLSRDAFFKMMYESKLYKTIPMSVAFYKEYNLPLPEPMSFSDFLPGASKAVSNCETGELRPIAEGGLRPIVETESQLLQLEDTASSR
jgi:hypothetical protein